ncbi:M24 family metallopeptidase [Phenylobacterium sp.]|uniref:M24 family metallopeptidase n=1 Tax=Phenylobacterium sp. TaxID=1871053 RepID=UPI00289F3E55|nr:M24 family metallopeptidase [Phenylobacterium sp.]
MGDLTHTRREAVGEGFSLAKMIRSRDLTFEAVRRIGAAIGPGITEARGAEIAQEVLESMGMERLWHRNVVRFGPGTLETFFGDFQPSYVLKADDIFYVDLGVVWDGHEGDAGDTFVVGEDAEMAACAQAARTLWRDVAARWRDEGLSGEGLYRYAGERAAAMGWRLNWEVKGHRVSDFPHAIYKAGALGDFDAPPTTGLWILEIQIAHQTRPIGAFYEDLLIREPPSP